MQAGVSSLGIVGSYGVENTSGTVPSTFNTLHRLNAIGGISLETEQIDASALEDYITRYIAGRQDTGGSFPVTVNLTDETIKEWEDLIKAYNDAIEEGLEMWFQISSPYITKAWFITVQPPQAIPVPDFSQNELLTVEIPLTISEYKGMKAKVAPSV